MTSTITSSGARQMQAFTAPSAQNTAPVLEYRCLYTHDLRRKQKRWQDGLLRFHTFNKRIMVYDESRNYIGDMHWREEDILHDGDEFQLDRGVLIQVGEATGSMEQDLTALLEKRKKAPTIPACEAISHQPVAISVASPAATVPSQIRPKPLTAVLGPRKGRTGRAALPTKSPHELRLENDNSTWNQDRPPKRQRIESELERETEPNDILFSRALVKTQVLDGRVNPALVGANAHNQSKNRRSPTTMQDLKASPVRDAVPTVLRTQIAPSPRSRRYKEHEASDQGAEPLPNKRSSGLGSFELAAQQRKRKPDQDHQVSLKAKKVAKRPDPDPETETGCAISSNTTKSIGIVSDADPTFNDHQCNKTSKLLTVSRKPRKKLMYRDLIPSEPPATGCFDDALVLDRRSPERSTSNRHRKRNRDPLVDYHKKEQERLKARLNIHRTKETQWENKRKEVCGDIPEGLSLSHEDMTTISESHRKTKGKGPKDEVSNSTMAGSRRIDTEPVYSSTRHSSSSETRVDKLPRAASTVHISAIALAKTDEILSTRPQPRRSEPVQGNGILPVVSSQEPSSPPILKTPMDTDSAPPSPRDRAHSSPGLQTQAQAPVSKHIPQEAVNTLSRPHPDSLRAPTKVVQPRTQGSKQWNSNNQHPDSNLSSLPPKPVNTILGHSSPNDHSMSAIGLQSHFDVHAPSSSTSEPQDPGVIPQMPNANPDLLLAFSKIVAPKSPAAAQSIPIHKPNNQPVFTKVTPMLPINKVPNETAEVLSSQPPTSPPHAEEPTIPPPPPKRKPDSLPAFTKVIPSKPRAPLKKSISDTAAMRPPSALPVPAGKENVLPRRDDHGKDECDGLWSKEAWDLFGCGRDGVECTYEEFKRKEGLM